MSNIDLGDYALGESSAELEAEYQAKMAEYYNYDEYEENYADYGYDYSDYNGSDGGSIDIDRSEETEKLPTTMITTTTVKPYAFDDYIKIDSNGVPSIIMPEKPVV